MDRTPQGSVEIGFSAEDQCKTVDGIIAVVHKHLDVIYTIAAHLREAGIYPSWWSKDVVHGFRAAVTGL